MNCEKTLELIRTKFREGTQLRKFTDNECLIRLPFWDNYGDPIEISVSTDGVRTTIDDAGTIAGLFFSLGQHTQDTPAFKLLRNLERAHGLEVDFNEGLLRVSVPDQDLYEGIAEFTKVVLALHTVTPHIRTAPRRMKPMGGRRLRSRIREEYQSRGIIELIEPDFEVAGITIPYWHADFHWSVATAGENAQANVYVVATDLNVAEPLQRAQRITAFSMDTRMLNPSDGIRVVMEASENNVQATEAARFLRYHTKNLPYRVFDFDNEPERSKFLDIAAEEILGDAGAAWRDIWKSRRVATGGVLAGHPTDERRDMPPS